MKRTNMMFTLLMFLLVLIALFFLMLMVSAMTAHADGGTVMQSFGQCEKRSTQLYAYDALNDLRYKGKTHRLERWRIYIISKYNPYFVHHELYMASWHYRHGNMYLAKKYLYRLATIPCR